MSEDKVPESWGEVVELNEVGKQGRETSPIVFHFRPTKYLKVAPDKLKDWEEFFATNVGLRPDRQLAYRWSEDPKETISGSNDGWDDCDYW
jgi:hypothetical protein